MGIVGKMKRCAKSPLRRWRSRGFGIHSPFAFDLVTRTLHERDRYYAYDTIDSMAVDGNRRRFMKLIVRLAVRFDPSTVATADREVAALLAEVIPSARILAPGSTADMAIVSADGEGSELDGTSLVADRPAPVTLIANTRRGYGRELWQLLRRGDHTMTFTDGRIGLACSFSHIPAQSFNVNF